MTIPADSSFPALGGSRLPVRPRIDARSTDHCSYVDAGRILRDLSPFGSAGPRLVVTDVDSTLIHEEVIEELAQRAGTRAEVAEITARAMNGELDFAESLHRRVATLAGIPQSVFVEVLSQVTVTHGVPEVIARVHAAGGKFGVVSGGFAEVVEPLCEALGIDFFLANRLEVADGVLTGRVLGEVVTAQSKVDAMGSWAGSMGVTSADVLAVGDGANDVPMLQAAGLGVAFCAKPAVRRAVSAQLDVRSLQPLLQLWG